MARFTRVTAAVLCFAHVATAGLAQNWETVRQVSTHIGEMTMTLEMSGLDVDETLRFEPYQQLDDMFGRDDVVFLMRHGPTDWSKLDEKNVAPTDCTNQRVMIESGVRSMRDFGSLIASNNILPSQIVVSEWCRNQQTVAALQDGFDRVDPTISATIPVETDGNTNLLLSLQGAKDVASLRERISNWEGSPDRKGPLLIVTHYTNIEELTQFRVFEGEVLILDPKRDNQVLGYLRLASAAPDVGHFSDALSSPLLARSEAQDMIERYYDAIGAQDMTALETILSDRWVSHGLSDPDGDQDVDDFLSVVETIRAGLSDVEFIVDEIHVAGDIVTVIGTIIGQHTGTIYGLPATGRQINFGAIAVHRIEDGTITESWQMSDRVGLIQQLDAQ
ncbi:MAG: ester cyclase [Pseudomonadota bacterium]